MITTISFFILILLGIILITQTVQAKSDDFPNISISVTYTFSLDSDGNAELDTIIRIKNLEHDFFWAPNETLQFPIVMTSYSKEQPKLTMFTFGEDVPNYNITEYQIHHKKNEDTYTHAFYIDFSPKPSGIFTKGATATLRIKLRIKKLAKKVGDSDYRVTLQSWMLPKNLPIFKEYTDVLIKVNLPNDPYYWDEILDAKPKYDYRTTFGRGESVEWWYKEDKDRTDLIFIDYRIHPDPLKKDLDNATITSLDYAERADTWGLIALIIAIVSLPWKKIQKWLIEKINNRP